MSDYNLDTNHANADRDEAWQEIIDGQPEIPPLTTPPLDFIEECNRNIALYQNPTNTLWRELGEHDWDLSVTLGRFGDDHPENEIAQERLEQLREHLHHLTADQLRSYIKGMHSGMNTFFWNGL
ncbi:hypothetical protein [Nocardioides sp.]|uniref:hypothetical protein n=1 Tax=Nocardioides sp. TaxID=35761 RepID=UPI002724D06F|nr:hypothetical protein [Nocardioides sp.]MDO9455210.1 hypothetical protein [Nocardioides sp.]